VKVAVVAGLLAERNVEVKAGHVGEAGIISNERLVFGSEYSGQDVGSSRA
jgi:hypothetical protein